MSLSAFVFRSLLLSINVSLRMIPIAMVALYAFYAVVTVLFEQPVALIIILGALYVPSMLLLYLNSVRAGLVGLKVTRPPMFKKLLLGTWRIMRVHFMLNNLIMTLLGVGGTAALLYLLHPDVFGLVIGRLSLPPGTTFDDQIAIALDMPVLLTIPVVLAFAVSMGVVGTSVGATAAWAADGGPAHDMIWGITRQFLPIFVVTLLVHGTPVLAAIIYIGGPFASLRELTTLPLTLLIGWGVYTLWAACAVSAAQAVGYAKTVKDNAVAKAAEEGAMMGAVYETQDIRDLRLSRQKPAPVATD